MPPGKSDLPSKECAVCRRPFTWRKKWQKVWDQVRHCSEACRRRRKPPARAPGYSPNSSNSVR